MSERSFGFYVRDVNREGAPIVLGMCTGVIAGVAFDQSLSANHPGPKPGVAYQPPAAEAIGAVAFGAIAGAALFTAVAARVCQRRAKTQEKEQSIQALFQSLDAPGLSDGDRNDL